MGMSGLPDMCTWGLGVCMSGGPWPLMLMLQILYVTLSPTFPLWFSVS